MEISGWVIYFISIADGVNKVFGYSILAAIASWLLCLVIACIITENDGELGLKEISFLWKVAKTGIFVFIISILGLVFTPSSKAVAAIYVIPKIVNNETLKEEANEFYIMAKEWLKSTLEEKPSKDDVIREKRKNKPVENKEKSSEKLEI